MKKDSEESEASAELCPNCGTAMVQSSAGEWYCPKCASEIDWGLDEDESES